VKRCLPLSKPLGRLPKPHTAPPLIQAPPETARINFRSALATAPLPALAAPENLANNEVVWMRIADENREAEAPETMLLEMPAQRVPEAVRLSWRGRGNIIAAMDMPLLDLLGTAELRCLPY
jgi:hypothetical protein